jgi:hypothetical protein
MAERFRAVVVGLGAGGSLEPTSRRSYPPSVPPSGTARAGAGGEVGAQPYPVGPASAGGRNPAKRSSCSVAAATSAGTTFSMWPSGRWW